MARDHNQGRALHLRYDPIRSKHRFSDWFVSLRMGKITLMSWLSWKNEHRPDQRKHEGTRADRRDPTLKTLVYFWVAIIASVVAAYAAAQATITSHHVSSVQSAQSVQEIQIKALVKRLSRDELATCVIQSRGLPAGHHLAAGLGAEVAFLDRVIPLGTVLVKGANAQLRMIEDNLGAYARIESKQPMTRKCRR